MDSSRHHVGIKHVPSLPATPRRVTRLSSYPWRRKQRVSVTLNIPDAVPRCAVGNSSVDSEREMTRPPVAQNTIGSSERYGTRRVAHRPALAG
ncbi:MAG TPA: hypothetical protein VF331_07230 [Polyangiales bacterium]